jgi:hypothetical protein
MQYRELVKGLSFASRISFQKDVGHTDVSLRIPFTLERGKPCSFDSLETMLPPVILRSPSVCCPFEQPTRLFGSNVCELTCVFEALPKATAEKLDRSLKARCPNQVFLQLLQCVDPVLDEQLLVAVLLSKIDVTASCFGREGNAVCQRRGSRRQRYPHDYRRSLLGTWYFKLGVTRSWEPLFEPYHFTLLYETSKARGLGLTVSSPCS